MLSEHNPIAELIHQIQQKWIQEASPYPEVKLVRWLIKKEEARLFEGFLKLESTEHGAIPEVLVTMLTPFKSLESYSSDLITDWCKAYKDDDKTREKLLQSGRAEIWNPDSFLKDMSGKQISSDDQFLLLLSSFYASMVDKSMRLVVALFPRSIHDIKAFKKWFSVLLEKEIPAAFTFMIFDHIGEFYFDSIFEKYSETTKTIPINLDLDGAISKIAKMGNPNSPEVKFRECILEMGQALQKNNQPRLHQWGEKALLATQGSGLKSMFASAHIVYAGMLFNFKSYEQIDALLLKGLSIAKQGLLLGDESCKPLLIQFYGYIAASKQLQRRIKEAIASYEKQGDIATEYQLPGMALTPYYQAYSLCKKSAPEKYESILHKAYITGKTMQKEELQNSSFPAIAYEVMKMHQSHQKWEEAKEIENETGAILGDDWKQYAKQNSTNFTINPRNLVPAN